MKDKQADFSKEARAEATRLGHFKTFGDDMPLPDQKDWENIVRLINKYRRESVQQYGFDILIDCISNAKKEHAMAGHGSDFLVVNKDSNMRHIFEFPESFVIAIQRVYPVMFTSKKHFAWFCRNFGELMLSEKY